MCSDGPALLKGSKAHYLRSTLRPGRMNSLTAVSITSSLFHANLSVSATSTIDGLPNLHPSPNHSSNFSAYFFKAAKLNAASNSIFTEPVSATVTKENPLECSGAPMDTECCLPSSRVSHFAVSTTSITFDRADPFMSSNAMAQSVLYIDRSDSISLINSEQSVGTGA